MKTHLDFLNEAAVKYGYANFDTLTYQLQVGNIVTSHEELKAAISEAAEAYAAYCCEKQREVCAKRSILKGRYFDDGKTYQTTDVSTKNAFYTVDKNSILTAPLFIEGKNKKE